MGGVSFFLLTLQGFVHFYLCTRVGGHYNRYEMKDVTGFEPTTRPSRDIQNGKSKNQHDCPISRRERPLYDGFDTKHDLLQMKVGEIQRWRLSFGMSESWHVSRLLHTPWVERGNSIRSTHTTFWIVLVILVFSYEMLHLNRAKKWRDNFMTWYLRQRQDHKAHDCSAQALLKSVNVSMLSTVVFCASHDNMRAQLWHKHTRMKQYMKTTDLAVTPVKTHAHTHCIRDKDRDRPISLIAYLGPLAPLTTISSRYLVTSTLYVVLVCHVFFSMSFSMSSSCLSCAWFF